MFDIYEKLTQVAKESSILIVDDSDEITDELAKLFILFFYKVDKAANGEEGLNKVKDFKYDVILTDLDMPILNGIEMIKEIKKIYANQEFIALSGYVDTYKPQLEELGVKNYMEKPYYVNVLFEVIIECLNKK